MTFFQIDPFSLIPGNLRTAMRDALVDFVSDQAKKHLGDEVSNKLKKLRSDAAFNKKFEEGLRRAIKRFIDEYEAQDEDLTAAIAARSDFFQNEEVQKALLAVLKQPGASLADEQDSLAQSFQSVLPERKNRERVNKAVMYLLKCLAEELWHLPELQPIYSLQFQRMTAEATRQQVELQKAQLMALTELNAGVRDALLQLTDTIAERKLLPSGDVPVLPERPRVLHNLPQPDYGHFIGREEEIKQIYHILQPYPLSQHHLVTIDGIGGIGKSALALEVAHRYVRNYEKIPTAERFEAVVWISAKKDILTAEGIIPRQQVLHALNDIFTSIAVTLQREEITRAKVEDQSEIVKRVLTQQRTLIIVDNLETIEDESIITFIRELPAPTKAIVTTRHRIDVAYPVRLLGIPWNDAKRLIVQECTKRGIALGIEEQHHLYERTGGLPLALIWSVAQLGYGYPLNGVLEKLAGANDITKFCFENAIERIKHKPALRIFLALSLFKQSADKEKLKVICTIPDIEYDQGLVDLEKLSLVNRQGNNLNMLPLTHLYAEQQLVLRPEIRLPLIQEFINYFTELVRKNIGNSYLAALEKWDYAYGIVSSEIDNIVEAARYAMDESNPCFQAVCDIAMGTVHLLWRMGRFSTREQLMYLGIKAARELGLEEQEAWFRVDGLGWIYWKRGEYEKCLQEIEAGKEIAQRIGQHDILAMADLLIAIYYRDAKEQFLQAENIMVTLLDKPCNIRIKSYVFEELGSLKQAQHKYKEAVEYVQKRVEIARELGDKRDIAIGLMKIGRTRYHLSEFNEAEAVLKEALDLEEQAPDVSVASEACFYLGLLATDRGENILAEHYLTRSIRGFMQLGLTQQYKQARDLLDKLAKQ